METEPFSDWGTELELKTVYSVPKSEKGSVPRSEFEQG